MVAAICVYLLAKKTESAMAEAGKQVRMATIGAPHGVRGEVRVKTFTGDPLALGDYGVLTDGAGRKFQVLDIRPAKTVVVVRFKGIDSREKADAVLDASGGLVIPGP